MTEEELERELALAMADRLDELHLPRCRNDTRVWTYLDGKRMYVDAMLKTPKA